MDDVFEMLKADHTTIRALYKQSRAAGGPLDSRLVFDQIRQELDRHTHIEETHFYPACEKHKELKRLALERYEEHDLLKDLLEADRGATSGDRADQRLRDFMQRLDAHIRDEEAILFPLAQKILRRSEIADLSDEVAVARRRLKVRAAAGQ